MDNDKKVLFYEREFYPFSNFSSFMLEWKGELYMTSEHAYHTEKFSDPDIIQEIKNARSAHDAFHVARAHSDKVRPDWLDMRVPIMEHNYKSKGFSALLCQTKTLRKRR